MLAVHQLGLVIHVVTGFCALLVFWIPVFTRKGSLDHKRFGRLFAWTMYVVAGTGMLMAGLDLLSPLHFHPPAADASVQQAAASARQTRVFALFLLSLSLLVLVSTRHGWLVIRHKQNRRVLRRLPHLSLCGALCTTGVVLLGVGLLQGRVLFMVFGALQSWTGASFLYYSCKARLKPMQWWTEHLGALIGAGIGAYTAFLVFGGSRVLAPLFQGHYSALELVLWLAPGLFGGLSIALLSRKYEKRFNRTEPVARELDFPTHS